MVIFHHLFWPGNELCGGRVGTRVAPDQYASNTIALRNKVQEIYKDVANKPIVLVPGGFLDVNWFTDFLCRTNNAVDLYWNRLPFFFLFKSGGENYLPHLLMCL